MQPWWVTHLLEFITNTAWPIVVLVIFFSIRSPIDFALRNLKILRFGNASLEINSDIKEIEREIENVDDGSLINKADLLSLPQRVSVDNYDDLEMDPRLLILESWANFERTLRKIYDQKEIIDREKNLQYRKMSVRQIIRDLYKNNYISFSDLTIITKLLSVRDRIVHGQFTDVRILNFEEPMELFEKIRELLENKFLSK